MRRGIARQCDEKLLGASAFGSLADTTSGVVSGVQALGNALSLLGGSGRSDNTTHYTLTANPAAYLAGTQALSRDVVKALLGGLW